MTAGTVQALVVCSTASGAVTSAGGPVSCGTDAKGNPLYLSTVQAYVVDPASAGYFDAIATPFDYTQAFGFWSVAFTSVVGLYFACLGIGTVVNFLRRA
ncbi:hypothetical protein [Paraburkholderia megapolitana]|uniref:Uncharacterized protein n=1 Tax=Paraburkholderia megapolitana TaxID=420953 RepID=A0A1I3RSJ1_9BURK|nr:hypothetical protein [Paraburkholderia megapolitana]SFJ49288.1 hypothetical protein SAMN05192543_107410 [Paraburkholderia megapolitana]